MNEFPGGDREVFRECKQMASGARIETGSKKSNQTSLNNYHERQKLQHVDLH